MKKVEPNYSEMMNSKEFEPLTEVRELKQGTLIGFTGLGVAKGITAAYPVWRVLGNEIQFVLYFKSEGNIGQPCIDNTWFGSSELCINKEPIIVDIEVRNPTTFGDELSSLFNS